MTRDEAMERIRKLLALSDNDGATQAEAERAAMHARRLLEEFQLSVADIEKGEVGEELSKEEIELVGGTHHTWQYALGEAVSTPLDCKCVFHKRWTMGKRSTAITFVGYDSDTRVARYLYVYLERALREMAEKEGRERGRSGSQLISYHGNFIVGASSSIRQRLLDDKRKKAVEPRVIIEASTGDHVDFIGQSKAGALVLLKQPNVEEFFEQEYPDCKTAKTSRGYSDQSALSHGHIAGKKIPLHKGVDGGKEVRRLV